MNNLFRKQAKKKALTDKIYFYIFYTVLLYLLSLTIVLISPQSNICLFDLYCVLSKPNYLQAALILYIYLLIFVIVLIQTYKLLEKLVAHKNHIAYFKRLFIVLPFLVAILSLVLNIDTDNAYLMLIFTAIISVLGLLMIELRHKK